MVSVVIPNYNHARYLQQRIDSVLNQTFKAFEVIILDDHSKDNSKEIIETYRSHPKVRFVEYNNSNSGSPFVQWQKGISLASGKYIWIAESDDFAASSFLEEAYAKLEEGFNLVYCRSHVVNEDGATINSYYWPDRFDALRWKSDHAAEGLKEVSEFLAYGNTIPNASACVFRKDKFVLPQEILTMKYCGDWFFWVNYLTNARLFFISGALNFHRRHGETTRRLKDLRSEIERLREYWQVIWHGRSLCRKGHVRVGEIRRYTWIFEEMFQKRAVIGFRGMLRSLPLSLFPSYLLFYLKKSTYKLIKG